MPGRVDVRFALVDDRDSFDPPGWRHEQLSPAAAAGHFEINVDGLGLGNGVYEYEFVIDGDEDAPVADPFAEEITRFGGYRGLFRIAGGAGQAFISWADEFPDGVRLPQNNELVICEIPMRWMTGRSDELDRQVGLGTFERYLFERLDELASSHINAIELLPPMDASASLNWGYGSRFFFAPDVDLGGPVDLKLLVKRCHQRGIRVLLDVVMNHSTECPLQQLADDWFYLPPGSTEEGDRDDWGGRLFRYWTQRDGRYPAREFHLDVADYWIEQYHVDGFRIDEFKGINNWDFVQEFRDRAWATHQTAFPGRPFIVIAEDSWRRSQATRDEPTNPNRRKVVDAIWSFGYRDEARRLLHAIEPARHATRRNSTTRSRPATTQCRVASGKQAAATSPCVRRRNWPTTLPRPDPRARRRRTPLPDTGPGPRSRSLQQPHRADWTAPRPTGRRGCCSAYRR
jgi:1,4-alpha-glucan branching enzyme